MILPKPIQSFFGHSAGANMYAVRLMVLRRPASSIGYPYAMLYFIVLELVDDLDFDETMLLDALLQIYAQ